ncbi:MAG: serine hydrolase domain-containing protein [Hyphomicrobiaceae bacterium]
MTANRETLDALLQGAIDRGAAPGVIAMATDGREVIYEGAFGVCEFGHERAMQVDTVCWLHSMTKAITGACVMQLVEQGCIGLDDDVGKLVPALAAPKVLTGFDMEGKPQFRPAKGALTLRLLLTNTSGFVYDMWNARMDRYMESTGISRTCSFIKPEDCQPLDFDPGTKWEYGIGIDWAGKVLEALTGGTLDSYMQKNLLEPLVMTSTGYNLNPEIITRQSSVHQRDASGRMQAVAFDPPQEERDFLGGGGMYGSAPDYIRFIRMIMNGGELEGTRVLKPETVELMSQNNIGDLDVQPLRTVKPAITNTADFFPGQKVKWGLTFMINTEDVPGRRRAGSLSWAGLRNTYFWIDPKSGIGGTIMTQFLPFADPAVLELYEAFERGIYAGSEA